MMPIYEFECSECGRIDEVIFTKITNAGVRVCAKCNKFMYRIVSKPFLLQESMRKRILGKGLQRMPETLKRVMRSESAIPKKAADFDEKYEPYW